MQFMRENKFIEKILHIISVIIFIPKVIVGILWAPHGTWLNGVVLLMVFILLLVVNNLNGLFIK